MNRREYARLPVHRCSLQVGELHLKYINGDRTAELTEMVEKMRHGHIYVDPERAEAKQRQLSINSPSGTCVGISIGRGGHMDLNAGQDPGGYELWEQGRHGRAQRCCEDMTDADRRDESNVMRHAWRHPQRGHKIMLKSCNRYSR